MKYLLQKFSTNIKKTQKRVQILQKRNKNFGGFRNSKRHILIITKQQYRLSEEQINSIKIDLENPKGLLKGKLTKIFKFKYLISTNKVLTSKGILVRMGKGKGKFKTKIIYLTKGTVCIELIPWPVSDISKNIPYGSSENDDLLVVRNILDKFISKYTFFKYFISI